MPQRPVGRDMKLSPPIRGFSYPLNYVCNMPAMSTANLRGEMIEGLNYAGLNESG